MGRSGSLQTADLACKPLAMLGLPADIAELMLEWVVAAEGSTRDMIPFTAARRDIVRLRLVARAWDEPVERVALACIEPESALVERLDATSS